MTERFVPLGSGVAPDNAYAQISRTFELNNPLAFFAVERAAVLNVAAKDFRKVSPLAAGMVVKIPAASAENFGDVITLWLSAGQGVLRVAPVSGQIDGGAELLFPAGITRLIVCQSNGVGWATQAAGAFTDVNVQVVTAAGAYTYTPSPGMKFVIAILTGAGGGSGGADVDGATSRCVGAGGGAAGGTAIGLFSAAQIGASQSGSVGAGGTAGANAGGNGGVGGNTTLGSLMTGNGGGGGQGVQATGPVSGTAGATGGTATGGLINIRGGDGDSGFGFAIDGTNDVLIARSGMGGASFWGGGARGILSGAVALGGTAGSAGVAAVAPGSGAGGATNVNTTAGFAGNTGADGIAVFIEFI